MAVYAMRDSIRQSSSGCPALSLTVLARDLLGLPVALSQAPVSHILREATHPRYALWGGITPLSAMIDTGSSSCLLQASAAAKCGVKFLKDSTALYGFGNRSVPVATAMGRCVSDLVIDGVKGSKSDVLVVPDDAQAVERIVGRTFTELPHLASGRRSRIWAPRPVGNRTRDFVLTSPTLYPLGYEHIASESA
ncbi:hypothetical protein HPB47_023310 [Ixodes persulcatus]|uniref:Uncharacterized protein n=1 Tax=Ixodes persulcatus TaxID=34615 RepID=A0AC60Q9T6_IXOPE|nr:hypothetical protein HPB47_023310 [Ixodes persulcatus]